MDVHFFPGLSLAQILWLGQQGWCKELTVKAGLLPNLRVSRDENCCSTCMGKEQLSRLLDRSSCCR